MPSRTTRPITLAGPDALAFANAQFTSDVLHLETGCWQWSGWLDPKGRVRALLQLARLSDDCLVAIPRGGDGEALAADMKRFVFRSKVKITVGDTVMVSDGGMLGAMQVIERDDGALLLGEGDTSLCIGVHDDGDAWVARHVGHGFAWLPHEALNTMLPPALSMERLDAVAFNKGCFPGQEIAARLHFLGGHKRHLRSVRSDAALTPGQVLRSNGRDIGMVLMSHATSRGTTTLVVVEDAAVQADTLETDGMRLHVLSTFAA